MAEVVPKSDSVESLDRDVAKLDRVAVAGEPEKAACEMHARMWLAPMKSFTVATSASRITDPLSSTVIRLPLTVTTWKFHSPAGRR